MNILVTGASGGFGKQLIPVLMKREKINIRVLEHRSLVQAPDCERVSGGLDDLESLMAATSGIDTVIHLAALTHIIHPLTSAINSCSRCDRPSIE